MGSAGLGKASRLDVREVIAAWVRERGLRGLDSQGAARVRVLNLDEVARRADTTRRNIKRLNATGKGPRLVQISARKVGVLEEDFEASLRSRRRPEIGEANQEEAS
jgi:hypothetical protein